MAEGRIEKNDIVTQEAIEQVEQLKKVVTELVVELSKLTKEQNEVLIATNKKTKSTQELATEEKKLQQIEQQNQKLRADLLATTEKVRGKEAELIKLKTESVRVSKAYQDQIKNESILNDKSAGSLEKWGAANKLARAEQQKLNLETEEGRRRNEELNIVIKENTDRIKENSDAAVQQKLNIGNYEGAVVGLRTEMRQLTQQLTQMKLNGQENSEQFKIMAQRLGDIKDSMQDVSNQAKVLGSDTKSIDMMVGSVEAVGSAAQVTEGTMQLLGSQNADVTKGIQRMVAIQSIMNGVQQIGNALQKESAFMMGISAAKTKVAAAAQAIYATAVGTSTGAMKAFRVALLATGIGALIAAIGLLIANWDKLKAAIDGTTEAEKRYNAIKEKSAKVAEIKNKLLQVEIDKMRALGKSESEIAKMSEGFYNNEIENINKQIAANKEIIKSKEDIVEAEKNKDESILRNLIPFYAQLDDIAKKSIIDDAKNDILKYSNKNSQLETSLKEQQRLLDNARIEQQTKTNDDAAKESEQTQKETDSKKEATEKQYIDKLNAQNEYRKEVEKMGKSELELEDIAYNERLQKAFAFGQDLNNLTVEEQLIYQQLEADHLAKVQEINDNATEAAKVKREEYYALYLENQQLLYDEEINRLNEQFVNDEIIKEEHEARLNDIEYGNLLLRLDTAKNFGQQTADAEKALSDFKIKNKVKENENKTNSDLKRLEAEKFFQKEGLNIAQNTFENLGKLAKKGSALQKIALGVAKAAAVAKVWVETATSNATISAQSAALAIPTFFGSISVGSGLIALNTTNAGIQTALIARQFVDEIGGFAKGTKNAPGGAAWVSEEGQELMYYNGGAFLTPAKKALMYVPKGAEIVPHDQIKDQLGRIKSIDNQQFINFNVDSIVQAIENKKQLSVNITEDGLYINTKEGSKTVNYINKQYKGEC